MHMELQALSIWQCVTVSVRLRRSLQTSKHSDGCIRMPTLSCKQLHCFTYDRRAPASSAKHRLNNSALTSSSSCKSHGLRGAMMSFARLMDGSSRLRRQSISFSSGGQRRDPALPWWCLSSTISAAGPLRERMDEAYLASRTSEPPADRLEMHNKRVQQLT